VCVELINLTELGIFQPVGFGLGLEYHKVISQMLLSLSITIIKLMQIIIIIIKPSAEFRWWGTGSGETSTLGQGGQIAVVGARVKTVKCMTSSCSFDLGTTFLQHSFPYKLRPNPRPPALC